MPTPKILAFAGSTRTASYNKRLVQIAAAGARAAGAEVTYIDLRDFPLPLFDEDLEASEGLPANAVRLKELMMGHQGFLIASPEYNSAYTATLKNAIDWTSRRANANEPFLACFSGKVAAIMSASPGALGGLRGLYALRSLLSNINVLVLPEQVAVTQAHEVFGEGLTLNDAKQQAAVENLGAKVTQLLSKLHAE